MAEQTLTRLVRGDRDEIEISFLVLVADFVRWNLRRKVAGAAKGALALKLAQALRQLRRAI